MEIFANLFGALFFGAVFLIIFQKRYYKKTNEKVTGGQKFILLVSGLVVPILPWIYYFAITKRLKKKNTVQDILKEE